MALRLSNLVANATVVLAVPLGIALAFAGHYAGLYPYAAVPFVTVGALLVAMGGLYAVFPALRRRERGS